MDAIEMVPTVINGRWTMLLPPHRAERPEWPWWEQERLRSMHDWITTQTIPPIVYDIGAEEGDMPALYTMWGARTVLFEPNPAVWPNIRAIYEANLVTPHRWYVGFAGDEGRASEVFNRDHVYNHGNLHWPKCAYGPVIGDHGFCQLWERPDIPATTIDHFAKVFRDPVDAITIDCEGSELRVLQGARRVLEEQRPMVWVAVHPEFMADQYGDHPDELHEFMVEVGYRGVLLADVHEEHWLFTPKALTYA